MITILPNKDVTDRILFELRENEEILGSVSGVIDEETLVISQIDSVEEIFYDGLVRAILAYADNRFVKSARFDITDERKLYRLRGFGFIDGESNVLADINTFFKEDKCD